MLRRSSLLYLLIVLLLLLLLFLLLPLLPLIQGLFLQGTFSSLAVGGLVAPLVAIVLRGLCSGIGPSRAIHGIRILEGTSP
ncbi:hypothetical protein BKA59DRAFT_483722 [Fusarium tricinctum]|uniref:Uncharacterized protein n=1 Tax=Fusarium tricinctum TaxID=61284 RepID=A0A8K0RTD4_9HYPO|nr:hypothetical protein BKA59DRAFT_483722 [Fusarium tricinctum]